ncbi:MAG: hypothetical protein ACRD2B_09565, partial [Terriglobia bacterium]
DAASPFQRWLPTLGRAEAVDVTIDANMLVGDVVRLCPTTLKIFARHNLDLCREAGSPLEVAARKHKLNLGRLLKELRAATRGR